MTDKQIIIDGVDVSGCEDYKCDGTCANSAYHLFNFETKYANCQNRNCYYKQLKRSEAQCEAMFVTHTDLEKKYKAKEQECEELNNIINEAKNSKLDLNSFFAIEAIVGEYQLELDQLKAENDELKNRVAELSLFQLYKIQRDEAEKTLTEIRALAEQILDDDDNHCPFELSKQILQKISECEVK